LEFTFYNFFEKKCFEKKIIFFKTKEKESNDKKKCQLKFLKKLDYLILAKIIKNPGIDFEKLFYFSGNYIFSKKIFYKILEIILFDNKIHQQLLFIKFNGYRLINFQFFVTKRNFFVGGNLNFVFFLPNSFEIFR